MPVFIVHYFQMLHKSIIPLIILLAVRTRIYIIPSPKTQPFAVRVSFVLPTTDRVTPLFADHWSNALGYNEPRPYSIYATPLLTEDLTVEMVHSPMVSL